MADLRTFSTAEEAAEHILTKGPSGEIQDGHGNNTVVKPADGKIASAQLQIGPGGVAHIDVPDGSTDIFRATGTFIISTAIASSAAAALVFFRASTSSPVCSILTQGTDIYTSNIGTPTGQTGPAGKINIFIDVGKIYVENRFTDLRRFSITLFCYAF